MIEAAKNLAVITILLSAGFSFASAQQIPHLRKQGSATQLIVDGKPFLIRGGELGNSTASNREYMARYWDMLARLNVNTLLVPVYWELIEPEEGRFDFTSFDWFVADAGKNNFKVVPLWFGSWKNSMSSYVPAWVKKDQRRFPRSIGRDGRGMEILSPFSDENIKADAAAFRAMMRHIRETDRNSTVVMVQVENEIGMIPDARDRSDIADQLYASEIPTDLAAYLQRSGNSLVPELRSIWVANGMKIRGTWEQVFGPGITTEEIFIAWYFAKFTERVTSAGKAEHPLPMFVNAALIRPGHSPGQYPSGGPLPHLFDIWRVGSPSIDFLSPDIYFQNFSEWTRKYDRGGNPFFIPEAGTFPMVAVNMLYAVGQHNAIGVSPFAIESVDEPIAGQLTAAYDILRQLEPEILSRQGSSSIAGLLSEGAEQRQALRLSMNGYGVYVSFDKPASPTDPPPLSGGLAIALGPDEFLFAGTAMTITFESDKPTGETIGLLSVDEGSYVEGKWKAGRRLNGDQTHQGRHVRIPAGRFDIQRVKLYRYR